MTRLCQYIYIASQGGFFGWPFLFLSCSTNLGELASRNDYFVKGVYEMKRLIANLNVGFTVIELMIVVAVFTVTLAMALYLATEAKTAITSTCQEDVTITNLTDQNTGYYFQETKYVFNIELNGPCLAPIITVTTQATGAQPDPVLTISGDFALNDGGITWTCVFTGLDVHVPEFC